MDIFSYPRPDFRREQTVLIEQGWTISFDDDDCGIGERWYLEKAFQQDICVPFAYQSSRSGIQDHAYHPILWYATTFMLSDSLSADDIHLCFGAVDYRATVWVNGIRVGEHVGGYTPFRFSVGHLLCRHTPNTVVLRVEDRFDCGQPRGKQYWKLQNEMCWYQASSGIWQSVWLEGAGKCSIEQALFTPDIDRRLAELDLMLGGNPDFDLAVWELEVALTYHNESNSPGSFSMDWRYNRSDDETRPMAVYQFRLWRDTTRLALSFDEKDHIKDIHYWWPDSPNLYHASLTLKRDGSICDKVDTYFGMRKIEISGGQVLLNHQPLFQRLVLDQGYWEGTHLTPPDSAALRADIESAKRMGFNGARKHQKIEDPRYYYWADVLGFLVWGELPSAYDFNRRSQDALMRDMRAFILRDYNHPSIISWIPLNESWGVRNIFADKCQQDFAAALFYQIKALDPTRLIGNNDGWEQVIQTDFYGIHDYTPLGELLAPAYADKPALLAGAAQKRMCCAQGHPPQAEKPVFISEYGGIAMEDHTNNSWGYFGKVRDEAEFLARYEAITHAFLKLPWVWGLCYTQLTDVYQEKNGLMTMDRTYKVDPDKLYALNTARP